MIYSLETNLKAEHAPQLKLDPLLKLVLLLPKNAPSTKHVVQRGEKGVGPSKDTDEGKVVGKVISVQLSTSHPVSLTTTSTTLTSIPITKGIVIGESVGDRV